MKNTRARIPRLIRALTLMFVVDITTVLGKRNWLSKLTVFFVKSPKQSFLKLRLW